MALWKARQKFNLWFNFSIYIFNIIIYWAVSEIKLPITLIDNYNIALRAGLVLSFRKVTKFFTATWAKYLYA